MDHSLSNAGSQLQVLSRGLSELKRVHTLLYYLEAGRLLLEGLYGGSVAAWERRGTRDAKYQKLCALPNFPMTHVDLSRALGIYRLYLELPELSTWKLTSSHLRAVLALELQTQVTLVRQAHDFQWTVSQLTGVVHQQPKGPHKTGRPRKAAVLRTLEAVEKFGEQAFADTHCLAQLPPERAGQLAKVATAHARRLLQIVPLLAKAASKQ